MRSLTLVVVLLAALPAAAQLITPSSERAARLSLIDQSLAQVDGDLSLVDQRMGASTVARTAGGVVLGVSAATLTATLIGAGAAAAPCNGETLCGVQWAPLVIVGLVVAAVTTLIGAPLLLSADSPASLDERRELLVKRREVLRAERAAVPAPPLPADAPLAPGEPARRPLAPSPGL